MSIAQKVSTATGLAYWSNSPTDIPERLILCFPGAGSLASDYLPLLQVLAKENARNLYVAPDLPGQGDSPISLREEPSFTAFVSLACKLCEELGRTQADEWVLIGHSMGCRLALETFAHQANVVSSIILLDGSWNGPNTLVFDPAALPAKDVQRQLMLKGLDTMFGPKTPETFKERYRKIFQEADLDYLGRLILANRRWDAERMVEALQQVQTVHVNRHPIRLLLIQATNGTGGSRRPLTSGEETSWMKLVKEHAEDACSYVVVEESGHWPHVDKTQEVAGVILPFIS